MRNWYLEHCVPSVERHLIPDTAPQRARPNADNNIGRNITAGSTIQHFRTGHALSVERHLRRREVI
jgi:hypothetical protein